MDSNVMASKEALNIERECQKGQENTKVFLFRRYWY